MKSLFYKIVIGIYIITVAACDNAKTNPPSVIQPPEKAIVETNDTNPPTEKKWSEAQKDSIVERVAYSLRGYRDGGIVERKFNAVTITFNTKPTTISSEYMIEQDWATGNALEKCLVDSPVRVLKKIPFLATVTIVIPMKKGDYHSSVSIFELQRFTGRDFASIKKNWAHEFSDKYVYDKTGRSKFLSEFSNYHKLN